MSLQHLDISYLPVTPEAMQQLAHGHWPVLTSLDLTSSFGSSDHSVNLKSVMKACRYFAAGNWPQLAIVELAYNTLNGRNVRDLFCKPCRDLKTLPGLAITSLNLSCNRNPSVVEGLAKADLQHLQVLNLSRCNELDLCDNGLQEEGVKHLVKGQWPFLMQLKVNFSFVNHVNTEALSQVLRSKWPKVVLDVPERTWV
ncbi:hypothetical protein ABBQ38_006027 [Trebouxia sp. C0009 RCD-2024]